MKIFKVYLISKNILKNMLFEEYLNIASANNFLNLFIDDKKKKFHCSINLMFDRFKYQNEIHQTDLEI